MEHSFLGNVARSLYSQYGDRISSLNIVLPNRRSRLFLEHELAEVIDKPLWQPTYLSVDELMSQFADIRPADRIRSVVELYKVWQEYHDEPFDRFYFWGEMLLGDFDQIDKYMIDAGRLFRNINEIKEIGDEFEYLAEEQRAAVARFWAAFSTDKGVSAEKERFRTIWNSLWPVYCKFRERLAAQGVGYAGMIHRTAAESITSGSIGREDGGAYVVIGFNALSACEKVLFDHLKSVYNADFFWDYDDYYMDDPMQEAGLFAKDNIRRYPHPQYFRNKTDNFSARKNISAASLPSDSLQCKYAATFLGEVWERQGYVAQETAIVLTNEDLLVPLLYSLPDYVKDVNVTMGYPLRHSLAYSFTERLLKLQNHARKKNGEVSFYHGDVTGLLEHPFILSADREFAERLRTDIIMKSRIYVRGNEFAGSPFLQTIFSFQEKPVELIGYIIGILSSIAASGINHGANKYEAMMQREFFGEIAETLRKLANSLEGCGVEMTSATVSSLARRMLQNVRIPYSGEPLRGLQVMGILETRNLDCDNVPIL